MSLEIEPAGTSENYRVVRLSGRLDAASAEEYRTHIGALIGEGPGATCFLVADLTGLKYISSAGLNLLIGLCRETRRLGGDFRLSGVQTYVREIFDLTGYAKIFKLYEDVERAKESIPGRVA